MSKRLFRIVLLAFIQCSFWAKAQSSPAAVGKLKIEIVGREEPINNLKQRTTVTVIQVHEANHRPVANAAIVIKPCAGRGPAGWFLRGKTLTGFTDKSGLIRTAPLRLDHMARLQIVASANGEHAALVVSGAQLLGVAPTAGALTATTTATVNGVAAVTGVSASLPAVIAGAASVGAVGVGGAVAAGGLGENAGSPAAPPTITIGAPGAPVFGPQVVVRAPLGASTSPTDALGFVFAPRNASSQWLSGRDLGSRFGAMPAFWSRLTTNRFLQVTAAHVSIGRSLGVNRGLTIGERSKISRNRVR